MGGLIRISPLLCFFVGIIGLSYIFIRIDTVSNAAMSVMSSYPSHGQDRNRIIVKLRTLVQELPSYVEGGKEVDCTHHLQLIQGYLHALGLGTVTSSESTVSNTSGGAGKVLTATSFPSQAFIRKYYILKGGVHNIDGVSYRIGFSP